MTKITHEAEVQRQHPRYRIPVRCIYNGSQVSVVDVSVGGIGLRTGAIDAKPGRVLDLTLVFPFSGYELSLPINAEVRYITDEHSRIGLRFVDVSPRQHNLLRFILDAYLSGEVVDAGDILDVSSRRNEGKTREVPQRAAPQGLRAHLSHHGRTVAGYVGIGALTLFLLGFIGMGLFERMYIIPAQSALITTDLVTVPAPSNGQVTFVATGSEVKAGEPLLTIQGPQGNSIVIDSPCNCVVQARYSRAANFVREGAPILALREKTSTPYVTASISHDQLLRFYRGASAVIEYSDGTRVRENRIERLPTLVGEAASSGPFLVKLAPGRDLDMSTIGQPVSVVFNTFSGSSVGAATGKLRAAMNWAGERIAAAFGQGNEVAAAPKKAKEPDVDSGRRLAGLKQ
ncbi:PilZ domain-containing protein [Microvirga terrae]|uniref:PilZ domain-containing protein n=1 Tax=Microvirga terrae TaxID=2740529 RepID=A0ABY5RUL8_9HYPH|nr:MULTISPECIES: PilZ domain-containing protein [Microvirga]MBQ0822443.1 PilZ domain-containing protein [Microvirga sp. HBU67558]UVF20708.1 PilZ domain-containing protein [Microvirga terrae]